MYLTHRHCVAVEFDGLSCRAVHAERWAAGSESILEVDGDDAARGQYGVGDAGNQALVAGYPPEVEEENLSFDLVLTEIAHKCGFAFVV